MNDIFFTSDTHFGHANIIKYCGRPFTTVEEMDETIIERWNSRVKPKDVVYHLGDFMLCNKKYDHFLNRLNGKVILIRGNHDHHFKNNNFYGFAEVHDMLFLDKLTPQFFICHYAMRVWPNRHRGSINLYGHSHGMLLFQENSWDVGVDNNDFYPLSVEEILPLIGGL